MRMLLPLPVAVPLIGMAVSLLAVRHRRAQRAISSVALVITLLASIAILVNVTRAGTAVTSLGGWPADISIVLVADRLASLMLLLGVAMTSLVLLFAFGQGGTDEASPFYHPAYLALAAGISLAFLSGDLFNLFVAFELLLMASYVLVTLEGNDEQIRSGTTYVVLNIIESVLLLSAVGLIFAATGTVSMAELASRLAELPDGLRVGLNLLLLLAFGMKAAVFPLFFWLPDSYPTAPSPVAAIFAGLLTKIGVYAMIRTETLLFPGGQQTLLLVIAGFTMIVGVLGAIAQADMKRIISFHIISQIGYMVMGLAIGGPAALAATVFYMLHHIPTKTSLFLVEGIIERRTGTSNLDRVSGLLHRSGPFALLFLIPALSLAGIPPFSGFVGKFGLVTAGFEAKQWAIVGVSLLVSLLTLVSMTKIWVGAFWGKVEPALTEGEPVGILRSNKLMSAATIAVVGSSVCIAIFAGPLYSFCESAARELMDPSAYVRAVFGR